MAKSAELFTQLLDQQEILQNPSNFDEKGFLMANYISAVGRLAWEACGNNSKGWPNVYIDALAKIGFTATANEKQSFEFSTIRRTSSIVPNKVNLGTGARPRITKNSAQNSDGKFSSHKR